MKHVAGVTATSRSNNLLSSIFRLKFLLRTFPLRLRYHQRQQSKKLWSRGSDELLATRADKVTLNDQYDIARFVDFTQTIQFPPPAGTYVFNGNIGIFAPSWSGNVKFEHTFDLGSSGAVVASLNDQFATKVITSDGGDPTPGSPSPGPTLYRRATNVTDLQLTYHAPDERWALRAYVENLQNEPILLFAGNTPAGLWGHARAPRVYGMRVSAKF